MENGDSDWNIYVRLSWFLSKLPKEVFNVLKQLVIILKPLFKRIKPYQNTCLSRPVGVDLTKKAATEDDLAAATFFKCTSDFPWTVKSFLPPWAIENFLVHTWQWAWNIFPGTFWHHENSSTQDDWKRHKRLAFFLGGGDSDAEIESSLQSSFWSLSAT